MRVYFNSILCTYIYTVCIHDDTYAPLLYSNNHIAAELLLESGADVNIKDDRGISPLALATISGHMDMVRVLLDQPRINVDIQVYVCIYCTCNACVFTNMMLRSLVLISEAVG